MVLRVFGLTEKFHRGEPILGYSDTETVKLDFDDTTFKNTRYWAERVVKWFRLGGFVILKSSKNSYHVIFNKTVSWARNMHIVSWVALQSQNKGLEQWFKMQAIKESSTLRLSSKGEKKPPRIVMRQGKQDKEIYNFLEYRKLIKKDNQKSRKKNHKRLKPIFSIVTLVLFLSGVFFSFWCLFKMVFLLGFFYVVFVCFLFCLL
jgi:hypothetical protein